MLYFNVKWRPLVENPGNSRKAILCHLTVALALTSTPAKYVRIYLKGEVLFLKSIQFFFNKFFFLYHSLLILGFIKSTVLPHPYAIYDIYCFHV